MIFEILHDLLLFITIKYKVCLINFIKEIKNEKFFIVLTRIERDTKQ